MSILSRSRARNLGVRGDSRAAARFAVRCLLLGALLLATSTQIPASSFTVTTATLTGPSMIICPPTGNKATYTISLSGTGATPSWEDYWFNWSVYQDEAWDDELVAETAEYVYGDASGNWSKTVTFELWCDEDCDITGPAGSSWDSAGKIFGLIETLAGSDLAETNRLNVKCCVPEPATFMLTALGVGVLGVGRRTARRRS